MILTPAILILDFLNLKPFTILPLSSHYYSLSLNSVIQYRVKTSEASFLITVNTYIFQLVNKCWQIQDLTLILQLQISTREIFLKTSEDITEFINANSLPFFCLYVITFVSFVSSFLVFPLESKIIKINSILKI